MVASNNDIPDMSILDEDDFEKGNNNKILVVDDE